MMQVLTIDIEKLTPHPANSNVMPAALLSKLAQHIERTDRYPPVIVRPRDGGYQILDGHHRVRALQSIGRADARCVVWEVDDDEALVLLATLNRLQGDDDAKKRAALVDQLRQRVPLADLAALLPEDQPDLERLARLHAPPIIERPRALADMPVAVHFFLLPAERDRLEARLKRAGPSRETALMALIDAASPSPPAASTGKQQTQ